MEIYERPKASSRCPKGRNDGETVAGVVKMPVPIMRLIMRHTAENAQPVRVFVGVLDSLPGPSLSNFWQRLSENQMLYRYLPSARCFIHFPLDLDSSLTKF